MNILKLINSKHILEGGSSKPLLINAWDGVSHPKAYVMKSYKSDYNKIYWTVAKEIIVCELAKQFGLDSPPYGIIDVDKKELSEFYDVDELDLMDDGMRFCTEYMEGALIADNELSKRRLDQYDFALLFAFDNLILNSDRGGLYGSKPNLLLQDDKMYLIDHETSFVFYNNIQAPFENNFFNLHRTYLTKGHVFSKHLKSLKVEEKEDIFEEFIEILNRLNLNFLNSIFAKLSENKIPHGKMEIIIDYLTWVKKNSNFFHKNLKSKIK